jgi:putative membrane protein
MATAPVNGPVRDHPRATVAVLSVVGYALVVGTFLGAFPGSVYPDLSLAEVNLLSDAIAVVNTVATLLLIAGWRWIRRGEVRKHAAAMSGAFALILVFLVMYLAKIGGGGTKEIVIAASGVPFVSATAVYYAYLAMLAVHVLLSIVSVPVVLYALVLGATHTPEELRTQTPHRRVGRVAAGAWILSLSLGVVTYLLLNHVYDWRFVAAVLSVPV